MKKTRKIIVVETRFILLFSFPFPFVVAGGNKNGKKHLTAVNNEAYKQACESYHFAYQAGSLPARSWQKILSNLPSHFREEVS